MKRHSMFKKALIWLLAVISCSMTLAQDLNASMACPPIKNITINWIELFPFLYFSLEHNNITGLRGYLPGYIKSASQKCGCPMLNFNLQRMNISSPEEIEIKIRSSPRTTAPELYFPIFANRKESTQYQRPFQALFKSPGPAVVELNPNSWRKRMSSINLILQTWPILLVCLLFGILAGFVVWAIEHKKNSEDFPDKFPHGVLVGIWWSFVTMTTVGYGDKTTRTLWGRLFAVFWMILGTIVMSMFTGQITANITSSELAIVDLMDKKVAVPTEMETFFQQEFNLGARYVDMSYREMEEDAQSGKSSMDYYLLHDYKMAEKCLGGSSNDFGKIVKSIDHQFVIGMTVTGQYEPVKRLLTCLQTEIIDLYQIDMAKEKLQRSSNSPPQESSITSQHILLIVNAILLAVLVLVGFLCEWLRKTKTRVSDVESQVPTPAFSATFPSFFDRRNFEKIDY